MYYPENHRKNINTLSAENAEGFSGIPCGTLDTTVL
jgi:hypothetical protein